MTTAIKIKCSKCNGAGRIERYSGIAKGVCFDCKGAGHFTQTAGQAAKQQKELSDQAVQAEAAIKKVLKEAWKIRKQIDAGLDTTGELKFDLKELEHYYRELKTLL